MRFERFVYFIEESILLSDIFPVDNSIRCMIIRVTYQRTLFLSHSTEFLIKMLPAICISMSVISLVFLLFPPL
jgi:hypothetical protein